MAAANRRSNETRTVWSHAAVWGLALGVLVAPTRAVDEQEAATTSTDDAEYGVDMPDEGPEADVFEEQWESVTPSQIRFRFFTGGSHQFETDIDGGGDLEISRVGTGVGALVPLNPDLLMNASASYEYSHYDFSTPNGLSGAADPWEGIHSFDFRALFNWRLDSQWSLLAGPSMTMAGEDGADFHDAIAAGGMAGFKYRVNEDLSVGLALIILDQLEDDVLVVPFPMVNWHIDEQWTLRVGAADLGTGAGPGAELIWDFHDEWDLAFGAQMQVRRFRLDDGGVAPNGIGEETAVPVYVRLEWDINPTSSFYVFGGVVCGGELRLENNHGNKISSEDYDSTAVLGMRLDLRF